MGIDSLFSVNVTTCIKPFSLGVNISLLFKCKSLFLYILGTF